MFASADHLHAQKRERWYFHGGKKCPSSDWLRELQTTPRTTLKCFVEPPFYYPGISIISIRPVHKRRETNLWQHKIKHGSGGNEEVSAFWRFTRKASVEAAGSPSSFY